MVYVLSAANAANVDDTVNGIFAVIDSQSEFLRKQ
jgi:hypothetical protein